MRVCVCLCVCVCVCEREKIVCAYMCVECPYIRDSSIGSFEIIKSALFYPQSIYYIKLRFCLSVCWSVGWFVCSQTPPRVFDVDPQPIYILTQNTPGQVLTPRYFGLDAPPGV